MTTPRRPGLGAPWRWLTRLRRAGLIAVLGFAAAVVALWFPAFITAAYIFALAAVFLVASAFSIAGRAAHDLQGHRGRRARVLARGLPLPGSEGPLLIESVASLGVGLLIRLQAEPGAPRILLKIAQPREVSISPACVTIGGAAYVQWAGRRIKRVAGDPSVALVLALVPADEHPEAAAAVT